MNINTERLIVCDGSLMFGYTERTETGWRGYVIDPPMETEMFLGDGGFMAAVLEVDVTEVGEHDSAFAALDAVRAKARELNDEETC